MKFTIYDLRKIYSFEKSKSISALYSRNHLGKDVMVKTFCKNRYGKSEAIKCIKEYTTDEVVKHFNKRIVDFKKGNSPREKWINSWKNSIKTAEEIKILLS